MRFFTKWKFVSLHLLLALFFSIGIAYYFLAIYLPRLTFHGQEIVVPDLHNMYLEEAKAALLAQHLVPVVGDSTYAKAYKKNAVVNHMPRPGELVKPGRKVYLTINSANPPPVVLSASAIKIIKLAGEDDLEAILHTYNLKMGKKVKDTLIHFFDGDGYIFELMYEGDTVSADRHIPRWAAIDYITVKGGGSRMLPDSLSGDTTLLSRLPVSEPYE